MRPGQEGATATGLGSASPPESTLRAIDRRLSSRRCRTTAKLGCTGMGRPAQPVSPCDRRLAVTILVAMPVSISILFDNPHAAFLAGETVSGKVAVRVTDKPKRLRALLLIFKGEARTSWSESKGTGDDSKREWYSANETYFDDTFYLEGGIGGELTLTPGEYEYPFSYSLPAALPSSLEGHYLGYIRYTASVRLTRPWRFDHGAKAAFTVVAPLDLNTLPHTRNPVDIEETASVCSLLCRPHKMTVTVRLPASGFVPGAVILFQVHLHNDTDSDVSGVFFSLQKEIEWRASKVGALERTRHTSNTLVELEFDEKVAARNSRSFTQSLRVPPLPPSHDPKLCRIIRLQYELLVRVQLDSWCKGDVLARAPVVVGTVPLAAAPAGPHYDPVDPTIELRRPPPYPDTPPPRYEESFFASNDIMTGEGDNQYTMGDRKFTPRYPVYEFKPFVMPKNTRMSYYNA